MNSIFNHVKTFSIILIKEEILHSLYNSLEYIGSFLDTKKAFDIVSITLMLGKLELLE